MAGTACREMSLREGIAVARRRGLFVALGVWLLAGGTPAGRADTGAPEAIFPGHRVVAFYGNPLSARMGILGVLPRDTMLARLRRQVGAWERADPQTPVLPALHLVAVVAQPRAGKDGSYRARTDRATVERVASWAEACGCLLFLDLQVGRSSVAEEIRALLPLLRRPYAHLALDPEFAVAPGQVPGRVIGTLDADDVNAAIGLLARVVREEGLPPKILVVHRFTERMLTGAKRIRLDPDVQLVIDMDGFGAPRLKRDSYRAFVAAQIVQYTGFKLFYEIDRPLMTEAQVLELRPAPLFILYQ